MQTYPIQNLKDLSNFKKMMALLARRTTVRSSGSGRVVGRVMSSAESPAGCCIAIAIDPLVAKDGSDPAGISIEIPIAGALLDEGQLPIHPSETGWYDAHLNIGETTRAHFNFSTTQWTNEEGEEIGKGHEILLKGLPFACIVVGVSKVKDDENPDAIKVAEQVIEQVLPE